MQTERIAEQRAEAIIARDRRALLAYIRPDVDPREVEFTIDMILCGHEDVLRFRLMRLFPGFAPAISHCINPYIEETDGDH